MLAAGSTVPAGVAMSRGRQAPPDTGWVIAGVMLAIGFALGRCSVTTPQPSAPAALAGIAPGPTSSAAAPAFYANCSEARAAGAAPIYAGQPGYRGGLDRDDDGIACE